MSDEPGPGGPDTGRDPPGTLVTIEGIDGSGKTTVSAALQETYPDAVGTCEPTDSWYGEAVHRSLADDESDPIAELFLYTADHADHLSRVIRPALSAGRLVIADRYSDSRYAYQGASLEGEILRPVEYIRGIHQPFTIAPDRTLYLDIDPETGAARSGANNKFEQAEFLTAVRANYETLIDLEPERFVRIDASRPPEDVMASAERAIDELLDPE